METLINCPICGSPNSAIVKACVDHTVSRETFNIVACGSCGFQYTNPRPEASDIGRYYESEEYISHSGKTIGIIGTLYQWVRSYTLDQKVSLVKRSAGKNTSEIKLLDIGCGTGEFLSKCKQAGMNVAGIEPSIKARKFGAESFGIDVSGEEALPGLCDGSYDVVTMWHVLEHVHNLKGRVEEVKQLLKPGGVAIIAVPNRDAWDAIKYGSDWAAYDVPRHLYHFTRGDIKTLFEASSFQLEKTLPMKFDSYYVSMLSDQNRGSKSLIRSTWNGLVSNMKASTEAGTWSSQIYILRRK